MYVRLIPDTRPGPARRLGRHVRHDPRSLRYLAPAGDLQELTSVRHERHIAVGDQGDVGACTGFAAHGCLGTSPLLEAIPEGAVGRPVGDVPLDEDHAFTLYSAATALDGWPDHWPPTDTGSDGLSVAKACHYLGLISGYRHATSLTAALAALAAQPVIAGINWYSSFEDPDWSGRIRIAEGATVLGGHEICLDELNVERRLVGFTNSWGPSWGAAGRGYLSWDDLGRLLAEDGDVTVLVPASRPAPIPSPLPGPARPGWRWWWALLWDWLRR